MATEKRERDIHWQPTPGLPSHDPHRDETLINDPEPSRSSDETAETVAGLPMTTPEDTVFPFIPRPVKQTTWDPHVASETTPPDHDHRTLILCFDGTGDQFDADNSNIVQLFSMLKKDERAKQMVYYQVQLTSLYCFDSRSNCLAGGNWDIYVSQPGVSTEVENIQGRSESHLHLYPMFLTALIQTLDSMLAWNLDSHVMGKRTGSQVLPY